MHKRIAVLVVLGTVLAGASAQARDVGQMFEQLDTDGDGLITQAEAEVGREVRFTRMDADKDGLVTEDEMRETMSGMMRMMVGRMFGRFDADGNGVIERAEFDAADSARFERMDANGDGSLTREEMEAGRSQRGG